MCNCDPWAPCATCARVNEQALAVLRAKLVGYPEGVGKATFTRTDGKTVVVDNVLFDTIGPVATNAGVVSMDVDNSDRIVHVPFVESWVIDY